MTQGIQENEPDARQVYADIIHLPRWRSLKHGRMPVRERAARFSAFSALEGYEEMIEAKENERRDSEDF